jgi:hypothetical protein
LNIRCERECSFEPGTDEFVLVGGRGQPVLDMGERVADATLFALEEVKRHRLGVVGLKEFLALDEEATLPPVKLRALARCFIAKGDQFLSEYLFEGVALVKGELVGGVMVDDLVFDRVDQDGLEGAAAAFVVATGADEVRIDPT